MGSFSVMALLFPLLLLVVSGSLNTTAMLDSNGTTPDYNNTKTLPHVTPVLYDSNETTPVYNGTEPFTTTPSTVTPQGYSMSCRQDPPLCCMSYDWSCYRGCHCDVGCLRRGDCCSDFKETCVTGFLNETTDLPTNGTNITSSGDFNASSQFPIWSLSGSCKSPEPMCCYWYDYNCYRGCFCDNACKNNGDCCPDYESTCSVTVLLNLNVRLLVPTAASEYEIDSALYSGAAQLDQALQSRYSYWWYYYNFYGLRVTRIARKP
ncbi:uncharacterized protein LOC125739681 isoform X1 [Brienomyrus brachyistius]|uniref:uncharacterized protein LOC125739681 isoform X1 n=1 Tax=Brienomyrus brachyistius TaxID=42636 RepID=UPI0020B2F6E0|nr:uncharacterized protein LOC125739681 isoform X1 [Brienomyrus brachyistius]